MTNAQLRKRLRYWVKVLRLQDWDIAAKIVRDHDMPTDHTIGCNELVTQYRQSTIYLLDPLDYSPASTQHCPRPQDMERTLVHELIHCYLTTEGQDEAAKRQTETIVDAMARAFVALDREKGNSLK